MSRENYLFPSYKRDWNSEVLDNAWQLIRR